MYRLTKAFTFEASHLLPKHDGKCQRLHGHSWRGMIEVQGTKLHNEGSKSGMLIDYYDLGQVLKPLVEDYLDHHHLNLTTELEDPTSENLAYWIYCKLKPSLPQLTAVTIFETCTSSAEYRP